LKEEKERKSVGSLMGFHPNEVLLMITPMRSAPWMLIGHWREGKKGGRGEKKLS